MRFPSKKIVRNLKKIKVLFLFCINLICNSILLNYVYILKLWGTDIVQRIWCVYFATEIIAEMKN